MLSDTWPDDLGDIRFQILAFDLELRAHFFGGDREQVVEQRRRQIRAGADTSGKLVVAV